MMPIAAMAMERMTAAALPPTPSPATEPAHPIEAAVRHPPYSAVPIGFELRACLDDFHKIKGIDFVPFHDALAGLDFTPDILPIVPLARLSQILDSAVEGKVLKLQAFAGKWNDRLEELRR